MDHKRRNVIVSGLALPIALASRNSGAQVRPCPPGLSLDGQAVPSSSNCGATPPPTGSGSLISGSDVRYLGYYNVHTDGNDSSYYQGMHLRRVGNEPRLLVAHLAGRVVEVSLAGVSYGSTLSSTVNGWNLSSYQDGYHRAIWWDEPGQRLWCLNTEGYTASSDPCRLFTMTLGNSGAVSNVRGPYGLSGVSGKRTRTGALAIPASFRSANNVGPYALGLGGYTSLMEQGGECAMGLSLYAIPDPQQLGTSGSISSSSYRALASRGATPRGQRMWYGYDFAAQTGKGPVNFFDGGDTRDNPSSRPSGRPASSAEWLSPASNGRGYWMWGDKYVGGSWVDGPGKGGVIMVGDFGIGYGWYQNSSLSWDGRGCELHVFDPQHLADALAGRRRQDSVEPVNMIALPQADSRYDEGYGRNCFAAFDAVDRRLYILKAAMSGEYAGRLYVYEVSA